MLKHRRVAVLGEIVCCRGIQIPVVKIGARREEVPGGATPITYRCKCQRCDKRNCTDENRGREQASSPVRVKVFKTDGIALSELFEKMKRDEVARDDEEYIYPDISAGDEVRPEVVANNEKDGDSS